MTFSHRRILSPKMPESVLSTTQSINLQCTLVVRSILTRGRIQNPTSPRTPGFVGYEEADNKQRFGFNRVNQRLLQVSCHALLHEGDHILHEDSVATQSDRAIA